jgi:serine/threonine protein kinase
LKTEPSLASGTSLVEPGAEPRWRLTERLAQGRSFDLWLAQDLHLDGHRAMVKAIRYASADPAHVAARRALLEAERDLYLLPPQMLPEPLDWLVVEGEPLLVYEHQAGDTLAELVRTRFAAAGLGEARAVRLVRELAHFLEEIHRAGFVLRDLSPDHVLLGLDDVLQVIGLGNACRAGKPHPDDRQKTCRTEGFSAPEVQPGRAVGPAADSYSLGALLGFLATGQAAARLPGPLGDLQATCLAAEPGARPKAGQIFEALVRFSSPRKVPRPAAPVGRPAPAPAPRPAAPPPEPKPPAPSKEPAKPERPAEVKKPPARPPEKRPAAKHRGVGFVFWLALGLTVAGGIAVAIALLRGG